MAKTFITKLPASVNNDALPVLGMTQIFFHSQVNPTSNNRKVSLAFTSNTLAKIVGAGHFTDADLSIDNGKSVNIPANTLQDIFISNDEGCLMLNKYNIYNAIICSDVFECELNQFSYSPLLATLTIKDNNVTGNISDLKNLTSLTQLIIQSNNVTGNISDLKNLTSLTTISIVGTPIEGTFDDLAYFTSLKSFDAYDKTNKIISGTLSKLPKNLSVITLPDNIDINCTWIKGERTEGTIFGSNAIFSISNIDDFLIDMATCKKGTDTSRWANVIKIRGNRTSASDSALAKLQELGYTVTIYS